MKLIKKNDDKKNKVTSNSSFNNSEVIVIVLITCVISLISGYFLTTSILNTKTFKKETSSNKIDEFIDTYNDIVKDYYGDIDENKLFDGAISGMLDAIGDVHTSVIGEDEQDNFNITLEGNYEGLGLEIANDASGNIVIMTVFDDTPASNAGLKPGDIIKSIDDKNATDITTAEFSSYVRNSNKTNFNLIIIRDDQELNFDLVRKNVVLKSVESKYFNKDGKKIGYIYVSIFAANTYNQFKEALDILEKENIDSLIIDLRDNTGGHLNVVSNMLSLFVDDSHVIYQTKGKEKVEKTYSTGKENKKYKIVILSNNNSASASEVMMGSLKENLNAVIVGENSYGKGSVQELRTLSDGTQYKITIKNWLTPKGNSIDKVGIKPDYEVLLSEEYYADPTEETDNQLQKALDVAK